MSGDPDSPPSGATRLAVSPRAMIVVAGVVAFVVIVTIAMGARAGRTTEIVNLAPSASAPTNRQSTSGDGTPSEEARTAPVDVVVHVLGAVLQPGLVRLTAGARVEAAIAAAGGITDRADLARVNLARPLIDGEQLYVPATGEVDLPTPLPPNVSGSDGNGGSGGAAGSGTPQAGSLVNINTADASLLATLPGIGAAMAGRIIAWREAHGRFTEIDQLLDVSGIGAVRFAELEPLVTL